MKDHKIIEQDVVDIYEKVWESNYFQEKNQWIEFDINGDQVVVTFDMTVDATTYESTGDYFTPPDHSVQINSIEVDVVEVIMNEEIIDLTQEQKNFYQKLVEFNL